MTQNQFIEFTQKPEKPALGQVHDIMFFFLQVLEGQVDCTP